MPEPRSAVRLNFTEGLEAIPPRPKRDSTTTDASLDAGREFGFSDRSSSDVVDGRSLRRKGAHKQLNLKVRPEDKTRIVMEAQKLMNDPAHPVTSIGEFVVFAVDFYRKHSSRQPRAD